MKNDYSSGIRYDIREGRTAIFLSGDRETWVATVPARHGFILGPVIAQAHKETIIPGGDDLERQSYLDQIKTMQDEIDGLRAESLIDSRVLADLESELLEGPARAGLQADQVITNKCVDTEVVKAGGV